MTQSDWLSCDDPTLMLPHLTTTPPSDRKLRLFACACAMLLPNRRKGLRRSIEAALAFADGNLGVPEMETARWDEGAWTVCDPDASHATYQLVRDDRLTDRRAEMAGLLRDIFGNPFRGKPRLLRRGSVGYHLGPEAPFIPITPAVVSVGRHAYDCHDFAALPVLADALEEGGCLEEPLLRHLRGETECPQPDDGDGPCDLCGGSGWVPGGTHARGCWALDLVLGNS